MFGVTSRSSGSSYSDLSKRFETLCRDKGLEIRPDDLKNANRNRSAGNRDRT